MLFFEIIQVAYFLHIITSIELSERFEKQKQNFFICTYRKKAVTLQQILNETASLKDIRVKCYPTDSVKSLFFQ